ncbi:MAG TPA: SusE domain-containing protein, partial [Bacteroidales bacterium]|nr:SusE domain-containing protein [Bacteroidales bacterium]
MKKIAFFLCIIIGTGLLFSSCEKDKVYLDMEQTVEPQITLPAQGASIILSRPNEAVEVVFRWSSATYPAKVAQPTYILQMARAGTNFANPVVLANTTDTVFRITQAALNARILGMTFTAGSNAALEFRVFSFITLDSEATFAHSATINATITTYVAEIIVKPIFMLGGGTTAGWDNYPAGGNVQAIQMFHITGGRFAVVDRLTPTQWAIKFVSRRGAWEPQWGAAPGGTAFAGSLIYRPTGADPDPAPIDTRGLPAVGDYRVVADTAALTYTIERVTEQLFLLGGATTVGWNADGALPMTRVSPGLFRITTPLTAGGEIKFIETLGQWQPQWGTNRDVGTSSSGPLYRNPPPPSFPGQTNDPHGIPSP